MKKAMSPNSYFFRAKVFAYLVTLSVLFYLFLNIFKFIGLE